MRKYVGLIMCSMLILTGCVNEPKLSNGQEVVVELNDKQFTAEDLYAEMKELNGTSAMISLVDSYITEQETNEEIEIDAKERAQAQIDQYIAYYGDTWNDVLTNSGYANEEEVLLDFTKSQKQSLVLEKYVASTLEEDEVNKYYDENIYGEMTVRHILIEPEVTDEMNDEEIATAEEEALAQAKLLINQLNENSSEDLEEAFSTLAKEESDDTGSASEGGLISNFTNESGLVEEFFNASYELEVGKMTSEPIETEFGYHIIYKVSQNEKPDIETVRDKINEALVAEILAEGNATYIYWAGLREKYGMNILDDVIKSDYNATMANY